MNINNKFSNFFSLKIILFFIILNVCSLFANQGIYFNNHSEILSFQQMKEKEIQLLLNKIYGMDQIQISIIVKTKSSDTSEKLQTLFLPGVPIQQFSKSYMQNIYTFNHYQVTLWINSNTKDEAEVINNVKNWLDFDIYSESTIKIFLEDFVKEESKDLLVIKEALNANSKYFQLLLENSVKTTSKVLESNAKNTQELLKFSSEETGKHIKQILDESNLKLAEEKSKIGIKEIAFLGIGILLILVLAGFLYPLLNISSALAKATEKKEEESTSSGSGMYGGSASVKGDSQTMINSAEFGGGSGGLLDDELTIKESSSVRDYFEFVNEFNILKLAYLLERDKPQDEAEMDHYWQTVAIIISYLPGNYGSIIFSRYDTGEQAELIPYLAYEIEYPIEEIEGIEKTYKEKVSCLVGGRHALIPLFDKFPVERKTELTMALHEKYPDVLAEIRDMLVLYEDVIALPKEDLTKLFMELDPNLLAMSIIGLEPEKSNELMNGLAEGLQAMIKEVIELRKDNYTDVEVANAKDALVRTAKALNRVGVIDLQQKEFGVSEGSMEQNEIDQLFEGFN
ncbi:MAG: hypothetical protein A2Y40_10065 [Candidatus Margulisbacteria bacterium GWF2_35_9]|nr:MAG: hypothetical protein A2Y40_10065 [Candidatus Margulisbacteria bacterium GWF2_35_9]